MKEKILFEIYKDSSEINSKEFRDRLRNKHKDINFSDVYTKINNYQIKKYGQTLDYRVYKLGREDYIRLGANIRKSRKSKGWKKVR